MAETRNGFRAFVRLLTGGVGAVAALWCALVLPVPLVHAAATVTFDFESDPGDYVGGGLVYHRTQADGTISINVFDQTGDGVPDYLQLNLIGSPGFILFAVGTNQLGQNLAPGIYLDAQRAPFASPGHPGLDVGMDGRGCNTVTGSFVINAVLFQGSTLRHLDLDFVQHCEGAAPALRGSVVYNDGTTTTTTLTPSSPSVPVGAPATLTATVTGLNPTGSVEFRDGLATIAGCASVPLSGSGPSRSAQCVTSALGVGSHTITASYSGDVLNLPSSGSTQLQVVLPGCAGFGDIPVGSSFCQHVEWIRNRGITTGCTASSYCPNDAVSRLAIAAFLSRMGTALTPVVLNIDAATGALPLSLGAVACQTTDFVVAGFSRRALANAVVSGKAASNVDMAIELVASFDAGQTWIALALPTRAGLDANRWATLAALGSADLAVGQSARFGVRFGTGGAPFVAGLADSTCQLRVEIGNRN